MNRLLGWGPEVPVPVKVYQYPGTPGPRHIPSVSEFFNVIVSTTNRSQQ